MKIANNKLLFLLLLLFVSHEAVADLAYSSPANGGILDQVLARYKTKAASWEDVIASAATFIFWTLGTISFTWKMGQQALSVGKLDFHDFMKEFISFSIPFGFFYWLLKNGAAIASSIITSLKSIGENAGGTGQLSPSDLVDKGFLIFKTALKYSSAWEPVDSIIGIVISLIILVILATITVNMLLLFVTEWVLLYAGIFFLGFGGSSWTSDMAINYLKTVLAIGVQLFTMILLVGVGIDFINDFYNLMNTSEPSLEEMGVFLVGSFMLWMLTNKIPPLVAGITGSGTGGIGGVGAGTVASAAIAGAAMAGAATAGAMAFLKSGAENAAGVADAVSAASENGVGSESGADPGMGSILNTSNNQGPKESGASALGQLMGDNNTGGGQSPGMGSRLIQGIKDVAKAKKDEIVSETMGGKIATAIRASDAADKKAAEEKKAAEDEDTNNSLSAGGNDPADEIAAFVNKGQ